MEARGGPWRPMEAHGGPWQPMEARGGPWRPVAHGLYGAGCLGLWPSAGSKGALGLVNLVTVLEAVSDKSAEVCGAVFRVAVHGSHTRLWDLSSRGVLPGN